jgi:signal transduction histidine kinase
MPVSGPWSRRLAPFVLTALAVGVAAWLELLLTRSSAAQLSLTPTGVAIAFAVRLGGLRTGLLALFFGALALDLVVIGPGALFDFPRPADALVFSGFLAGWLAFCVVADGLFRRMRADEAARIAAERAARQSDRIAQLTSALSQARTQAAAIEAAVMEPLHALRADAGILLLTSGDGSTAEVSRVVGHPGVTPGTSVPLTATRNQLADAAGRGATVFVTSPSAPGSAESGGLPWTARGPTSVTVPLLVGSRVVALAHYDFAEPRTFSDEDRAYLDLLAVRGAQALDRTWQYEYALRARAEADTQRERAEREIAEREKVELALRASEARGRALAARTTRLHGLTAALSEAVTLDAVAHAVVHQGLVAAGSTAGEVTLLEQGGAAFRTLYATGQGLAPSGSTLPVEPGHCSTEAVTSAQPVFIASFEDWQQRFPAAASRAADGGYVSSATVPLLVENRPIGVLAFYFTAPVNFDPEYRALLVSVAQDCAQALDRARLYESAQQARAEAEAANRLKDEFVSIVSHELRTPLNAILGWAAVLRRTHADPALTQRALQSVHDNATRQARLIEELLDFSRIASGRLALTREDVELRELLRGVVETMIPQTAAKNVALELSPVPSVLIRGDASRLEQVFFNLLGNALKFTPEGGRITVVVERQDGLVAVRVADTGVGIDPQVLPFIFDRFRQGEEAARREYGGLGLGLSIARQLVEAHGGEISASSRGRGQGATFTILLPVHTAGPLQRITKSPTEQVPT